MKCSFFARNRKPSLDAWCTKEHDTLYVYHHNGVGVFSLTSKNVSILTDEDYVVYQDSVSGDKIRLSIDYSLPIERSAQDAIQFEFNPIGILSYM